MTDAKCLRMPDKAILVAVAGEEIWIPKSVVHDDSEVYSTDEDGREGTLRVKLWWAEKNGHV